ncbi:CehA/McbA family metallohydrolase [uncultured Rubinisphaera sp.]|uniref:CehA/McbA family metallohydrolase n=1 Tax=uncultured Rubinisphaera sp. TaxID=1678686 RepID=UPI0030D991E7
MNSLSPLRQFSLVLSLLLASTWSPVFAAEADRWNPVYNVPHQPLISATERLIEATKFVGAPISDADLEKLKTVLKQDDELDAVEQIQEILDSYCIAYVHINPESRVKSEEGPAEKQLVQQGWRTFLVKVHNEAGINPTLVAQSPQAQPVYMKGQGARQRPMTEQDLVTSQESRLRFLDLKMFDSQPLRARLSGLNLEYRIIQLYSRDQGKREATLSFNVGQGTQDLGFRGDVPILFDCKPSAEIVLNVTDHDGTATMAAFTVKDENNRVYPNPARRLAPDFFFHDQVYRETGEVLLLPAGNYTVEVSRGPEYRKLIRQLVVAEDEPKQQFDIQLERWIHPASRNWFSGDHHVHAAGCAHYDSPTEGVGPADMMRHILGEDLNVGCVLSWGPCWYTQKQFFEGQPSNLSTDRNLMRYDVEVSGFPSSHAGHLCLLRLIEDDYPGAKSLEQWPSWTLPVLLWTKQQGGVAGYSHSGWGLTLPDYDKQGNRIPIERMWGGAPEGWPHQAAYKLPDYAMPAFDGIGANEYIMTVTHDACDFISAVDTPAIWELNIWYHTLNCGYRTRISGETDFPCIYGERVGLGRIYVKLDDGQELSFDSWVQGLKAGRSYCGDGQSHLMDFRVNDVAVGEPGSDGQLSQLNLPESQQVKITCDVAALLEQKPRDEIRNLRLDQKPYWHIERCRLGTTQEVPVELVINGEVVATKNIVADGSLTQIEFEARIEHSSWVALRILPSCHTNPVFVEVDNSPIRASKRSAKWCRKAVDVCWEAKKNGIRNEDHQAAEAAYEHARQQYDRIYKKAFDDE